MLSEEDLEDLKDSKDAPQYCIYQLNEYLVEAMTMDQLSLPGPFYTMMMKFLQDLGAYQSEAMRIQTYKIVYGAQEPPSIYYSLHGVLLHGIFATRD